MRILLLVLLIMPLVGLCQKAKNRDFPTTILDSIVYDLTPKKLAPSSIQFPFKSIELVDARFDTSKLGYEFYRNFDLATGLRQNDFRSIKLTHGVQESLHAFFNDYYSLCLKDAENKLLIVVKKLWINTAPRDNNVVSDFDKKAFHSYQDINIKWEYYLLKENKYYPYKRVDTVYRLTEQILNSKEYNFKKNDLSFFTYMLKAQLERYDFADVESKIASGRSITYQAIDSFNKKRFQYPVFTASVMQKGVYQTFDQFRNNAPGIVEYELNTSSKEKYWMDKKTSEVINDYYLMADSNGIHFGSVNRRSVNRVGNAFEYFELCKINVSKSTLGNFLRFSSSLLDRFDDTDYLYDAPRTGDGTRAKLMLVPRQIDMETGEVY